MAEKFYKVAESELVAIADAIRFQKKLTPEQRKYTLKEMPKVIKAMLVLPSDYGSTEINFEFDGNAHMILPEVYKGRASESLNFGFRPSASAILPDVQYGVASVTLNLATQTNAVGILTE